VHNTRQHGALKKLAASLDLIISTINALFCIFPSGRLAGFNRSDFDASIMFYPGRTRLEIGAASTSLGFQHENVFDARPVSFY
jgi:hypothetical protein